MASRLKTSEDFVMQSLKRLAGIRQSTMHNLVLAYQEAAGKVHSTAGKTLKQNDDEYRRKKVRTERLEDVKLNDSKKKNKFITVSPEKYNENVRNVLRSGGKLTLANLQRAMSKKKKQTKINEEVDDDQLEEGRKAAGQGERLLRGQSLRSVGKRIGKRASPPTLEATLARRAKRSARYALRKKLAPNYQQLSTGQKQDIDQRIAKHPQLSQLTDTFLKKYRTKYARKQTE